MEASCSRWEAAISGSNTVKDDALLIWSGPASSRAVGGLAEHAYRAIRNAIQEGRLEAGQRVLELELCSWLKVSRTPIREALRRLQSDGMLVHAPGGGLSVAQHDLRAVAELYDVRERLEGTAAALSARFADATEVHMLQAMVDLHRQLPDDPKVHARENIIFHEHIYRAAHNRFLLKSLQDLHDSVVLLGRTTFAAPGRIAEALGEHQAIVAAIAQRNEAEAEELMRRHVRRGYELRLSAMAEAARAGSQHRLDSRKEPPDKK
ncbi:MAG: GntR family transcriptional regulator [Bradyrhizobium sp.]|uniref:GntR family transcriptional regulator n=1 Tax=Bradyrhizobium sp. TaxID=376 RepID=UPI001D92E873|nr:GntR family transcriptional regulator [Bradyrhizobium sp.]MBV9566128.1 GntR family transcriptional regulator [Bradyrhizobium sp.]